MKKICIGVLICVMFAIAISSFFINVAIDKDVISIIYGVTGVMFPIGMSLSIVSNTGNVRNKDIRVSIRHELKRVRNNFILLFITDTFLFILFTLCFNDNKKEFVISCKLLELKPSMFMVLFLIYSIIYIIVNFLAINRLNEQIEEAINDEMED